MRQGTREDVENPRHMARAAKSVSASRWRAGCVTFKRRSRRWCGRRRRGRGNAASAGWSTRPECRCRRPAGNTSVEVAVGARVRRYLGLRRAARCPRRVAADGTRVECSTQALKTAAATPSPGSRTGGRASSGRRTCPLSTSRRDCRSHCSRRSCAGWCWSTARRKDRLPELRQTR